MSKQHVLLVALQPQKALSPQQISLTLYTFKSLSSCKIKPVPSLTPDYADAYVPLEAQSVLPLPLRALYNKDDRCCHTLIVREM